VTRAAPNLEYGHSLGAGSGAAADGLGHTVHEAALRLVPEVLGAAVPPPSYHGLHGPSRRHGTERRAGP
jgi:hypothetical protein